MRDVTQMHQREQNAARAGTGQSRAIGHRTERHAAVLRAKGANHCQATRKRLDIAVAGGLALTVALGARED